jgi:xanthine dehydrogenase accessory factor
MSLHDDVAVRNEWVAAGKSVAAATVIAVSGTAPRPPGARMLVSSDGDVIGSVSAGCVDGDVVTHARKALESGRAAVHAYGISDEQAFEVGLACGGSIRVLVEPW